MKTVLDNTMGSNTTGLACLELNRNYIGIENDQNMFEISKKRVE
jgi:site-specific DNA-methyltransferase (adenine-specific)